MITRDDLPDTPDWQMPLRPSTACEAAEYDIPPNIELGAE